MSKLVRFWVVASVIVTSGEPAVVAKATAMLSIALVGVMSCRAPPVATASCERPPKLSVP